MLDTPSLFDTMEQDDTQRRVASRRALVLAHHRIESSVGRFLRGARNEDEFFERLALVQDDFAGHVSSASAEVGHEHPEHIAAALRDHYRLAADGNVEFVKPADEEEEEDEGKHASASPSASERRWTPRVAGPNYQQGAPAGPGMVPCPDCGQPVIPGQGACPSCGSNRALLNTMSEGAQAGTPGMETHPDYHRAAEGKQSAPLHDFWGQPNPYDQPGNNFYDEQGQPAPDPMRNPQGYVRPSIIPPAGNPKSPTNGETDEGFEQIPYGVDPNLPAGQLGPRDYPQDAGLQIGPTLPPVHPGPNVPRHQGAVPFAQDLEAERAQRNPGLQQDTAAQVTCPHCGGGNPNCPHCGGRRTVPNFGGSVLDAVAKTADDQNNTGLGGPEPKMDKSQGPGSKPEVPGKIEHKDILKAIIPKNTDELKEIGDTESKDLPSNSDDAGFDTGGVDSGPHTDTFDKGKHADPVTRESLSSANPLIDMLGQDWPSEAVVQAAFDRY